MTTTMRRRATRTTTPRRSRTSTSRDEEGEEDEEDQGGDPRVGPPQRPEAHLDAQARRGHAGGVRGLLQVADERLGGPRGGQALLGRRAARVPLGPLRAAPRALRHVRRRK